MQHLDPNAIWTGQEDAEEELRELDNCYANEGGAGITVADLDAYFAELRGV